MGSGLWSVVCGLWSVVCGLWSVVCGLWSAVCGLWSVVSGLFALVSVSGLWALIFRLVASPYTSDTHHPYFPRIRARRCLQSGFDVSVEQSHHLNSRVILALAVGEEKGWCLPRFFVPEAHGERSEGTV